MKSKTSKVTKPQRLCLGSGSASGTVLTARTGGNGKWGDYISITVGCREGCCGEHTVELSQQDFRKLKKLKPSRFKGGYSF